MLSECRRNFVLNRCSVDVIAARCSERCSQQVLTKCELCPMLPQCRRNVVLNRICVDMISAPEPCVLNKCSHILISAQCSERFLNRCSRIVVSATSSHFVLNKCSVDVISPQSSLNANHRRRHSGIIHGGNDPVELEDIVTLGVLGMGAQQMIQTWRISP